VGIERVGHVVLKMRDLEAAKRFYGDILGMKIASESPSGVFFRFDEYHHDIAVFKVSENADPPKDDQVGLAHVALVADSLDTVRAMYRRLKEYSGKAPRTIDHGSTKSLYVRDPEGNQIEIYCEVPEHDWRTDGFGGNQPLDLEAPVATA
jgi:catechol 2,3-dioxygenase